MKAFAAAFLLLLVALQPALAQQKHNFLAIDNAIHDEAGPYYFIDYGDSRNAFAKAAPLAAALGLRLSFDDSSKSLVFERRGRIARLPATSDVAAGLVKQPGLLRIGNEAIDSPMGIIVDGVSYVAITPVVKAFFGADALGWYPDTRVITIDTFIADEPAATALPSPRIGLNDGVSRVAIDLPSGQPYRFTVRDNALIVTFQEATAPSFRRTFDDPNLLAVSFDMQNNDAALVVQTRYPLSAEGRGYRIGRLQQSDHEVLYIDFAPDLEGESLAVEDGPLALPPSVPQRRVIVIDAGHGGHDPGTTSAFAVEEEVVLSIAMKLRDLLTAQGVDVILTRDRDTYLTLEQRSRFATPERNLFVSIHANAAPSAQAQGIETWVFGEPLDPRLIDQAIRENGGGELGEALTEEALRAANDPTAAILRETQLDYSLNLAEIVQQSLVRATGARDRGVRQNLFYVIRTARTPAILVEVGFVSNPEEGKKLATDNYRTLVAEALAEGIMEFLDNGGTLAGRP